ncbi:MAG: N,N'-diacetylchitobiose phosphorylase [Treponema sp.]|jgi:cellobiose phosphorylase|nr:N,N'-diacetylchitobiose phosphorylase [Treponema sp.]
MKYGHFDPDNREYVITKPDTPAPWANYLGSPEYGAIITNGAGGYSFVKSGAAGRIMRYVFNSEDKPGRYIYMRDDADGDFWSASWQPVGKNTNECRSECRHGAGYTTMIADYRNITSEALYYVPDGQTYEVWRLKVTNKDDKPRNLSVFGYAEFSNESDYEQDQVNLQYTLFITRTYFNKNHILQTINENCANSVNGSAKATRFFALAGAPVETYCGDRDAFLGAYNGYGKPQAVRDGRCANTLNYCANACGALHAKLALKPDETRVITFLFGEKTGQEADALAAQYESGEKADKEAAEIKRYWHSKLDNFKVNTPDADFNNMINTWNAYQCFTTFVWSRAASLIYCGQRNGYGYRDTVQDIQGIIHLDPEAARERLRFMLSAQVHHGGALPLVKFNHNAGHEDTPEDESYVRATGHPSYRADDALWLFPTMYKYIAETGDTSFLDEVIPYADTGSDTAYNHLLKAIDFSLNHAGIYGLPAGLHADWNDCLRLGAKGVSVFVAFQLYYAFAIAALFAEAKNNAATAASLKRRQADFGKIIEEKCWEGDRFVRGFSEKGEVVGSKTNKEASFWLNPQSWAVISGFASGERAAAIMDGVYATLNTPYGARIMAPAYKEHPFDGALAILFNAGVKENAGVFLQTQGWLILAEALLGRGDRAFEYYRESCPSAQNDIADIRKLEPYVYGQFTEGSDSPFMGRSHVHWLTGTASTIMAGCVEGILGIRPDLKGLRLAPSIPSAWKEFAIEKRRQGKLLKIKVLNPNGKQSGWTKLTLNGAALKDNYIENAALQPENEIVLEM